MADLLRGKWSITALASHCTDMPTSLILSEAESQCNIWVSQTQAHTYTHRHTFQGVETEVSFTLCFFADSCPLHKICVKDEVFPCQEPARGVPPVAKVMRTFP